MTLLLITLSFFLAAFIEWVNGRDKAPWPRGAGSAIAGLICLVVTVLT